MGRKLDMDAIYEVTIETIAAGKQKKQIGANSPDQAKRKIAAMTKVPEHCIVKVKKIGGISHA